MIPGDALSSQAVSSEMLAPDRNVFSKLRDYEDGGVGIQNTSNGLTGYAWSCYARNSAIFVEREGLAPILVFEQPGIVEISFAFDQNMRPNFAYQLEDGTLFLRWFDTSLQAYRTDSFGAGRNPRLTLDDKRPESSSASDVIFAYIRGSSIYYRQQRDRFQIERFLIGGFPPYVSLKNVGMTRNMRLLFEVVE